MHQPVRSIGVFYTETNEYAVVLKCGHARRVPELVVATAGSLPFSANCERCDVQPHNNDHEDDGA